MAQSGAETIIPFSAFDFSYRFNRKPVDDIYRLPGVAVFK